MGLLAFLDVALISAVYTPFREKVTEGSERSLCPERRRTAAELEILAATASGAFTPADYLREGAREHFFLARYRAKRSMSLQEGYTMDIAERSPRELVTTTTSLALAERLIISLDQPTAVRVRGLARLCRELSQQYREAPETCLARSWWRLFKQVGIGLHEALDQAKVEGYPGLSNRELEQAYFLFIHVAYFFEPGGLVELLWPQLPPEPEDQQAPPARSSALGVSFGALPQVSVKARARARLQSWWLRLGQMLGRTPSREISAEELQKLAVYGPPPLDDETV